MCNNIQYNLIYMFKSHKTFFKMKNTIRIFSFFLLLVVVAISCNDFAEEHSKISVDSMDTRGVNELFDYYWSGGKKVSIERSVDKFFVLFRSSDKEIILSSLSRSGISVNFDKINKYNYDGTDFSGNSAKFFLDCEWAEVNSNSEALENIPEIMYIAPFYNSPAGDTYPLTNLVYVYLNNSGDVNLLEKLAKENNVGIIGSIPEAPLWYVLACTKESNGNALEISNLFNESGLFNGAEPVFLSRKTLGAPNPNPA